MEMCLIKFYKYICFKDERIPKISTDLQTLPQLAVLLISAIEAPQATPGTQRLQPFAIGTPKFRGRLNQQSENNSTIILRSVDQPGLRDQPAELDQPPRAFAPLHDPGARVVTRDRKSTRLNSSH